MSVLNARIEFEPDTRSLKESRDTVEEELDEPETIQFDAPDTDEMAIEPPAVDAPALPAPDMPSPDGTRDPPRAGDGTDGGGGGGAGGAVAGAAVEAGAGVLPGGGGMPDMGGMQKSLQPLQLLKGMAAHLAIIALAVMAISKIIEFFQPILDILGLAVKVALMPLAMVALEHLLPFAIAGLEMALAFVDLVQEKGLAVALGAAIVKAITHLPKMLLKLVSLIVALPLVLAGAILKFLSGFFRSIGLDRVADLLDDAAEFLFDMAEFVTLELPGKIWSFFKEGINFILDLPGAIWNKVQQLADMIADIIPNPGKAVSKLPGLAAGGVVTSETAARVGEAGPEAVVPLDRFGELVSVQVAPPEVDLLPVTDGLETIADILRDILREMERSSSDTPGRGTDV